ncbi:MAG: tetratricopeptide repeat protein [Candidatus Limiplasma sp.]|nr:tetratricopeptide repeat protein [Candidatus Limiplasma sp.]
MTNLHRPEIPGQVVSFERPSHYWFRRAQRHRKRGEHHQAAALLRRAVALEPASGELRLEYAQCLRDMSCYEASIREAFGVLALEPSGFLPYGLIGRNMLSLGREQEAMDAFAHYLQQARSRQEDALLWEEEDASFVVEDLLEEPHLGSARYEALLHIASIRLAQGDVERCRKRLVRAARFGKGDARLHALFSMLYQATNRPERALHHAKLAARENPRHVASLCALASVRMQRGERGLAAAAMLAAAFHCRYPYDEQLFCFTASALDLPEPMLAMLRLGKRRSPDRVPTLYNLALALLRQGKAEEAMAHLHRCRDLDPEDVTALFMTQTVAGWTEKGMSREEQSLQARRLPFYPLLPPAAEQRLLETLAQSLGEGLPAFVEALQKDGLLYRQYLYALASPVSSLGRSLFPVGMALAKSAPDQAERLLRDVLLQSAPEEDVKRLALSMLVALDAAPPYVLWQSGRIIQVDPKAKPDRVASVIQRLMLRRIRVANRAVRDSRLSTHALKLLRRMDHRTRYAFAADVGGVWRDALIKHFRLTYGLEPRPLDASPHSPHARQRSANAFERLCALMPIPQGGSPDELH